MNAVRVRRVGNSNVITVPRELERFGLVEGASVAFVPMQDGQVLIIPAERMPEYLDEIGQQVIARRRGALEKLAAHDAGQVALEA